MGNVQVKYKAQRGSHPPGTEISDPKDWLEALLVGDRDNTLAMYGALTDDQKEQLNQCFDDGDADVFRNVGSANGWIGEADDEDFEATAAKVKKVLAGFQ